MTVRWSLVGLGFGCGIKRNCDMGKIFSQGHDLLHVHGRKDALMLISLSFVDFWERNIYSGVHSDEATSIFIFSINQFEASHPIYLHSKL